MSVNEISPSEGVVKKKTLNKQSHITDLTLIVSVFLLLQT